MNSPRLQTPTPAIFQKRYFIVPMEEQTRRTHQEQIEELIDAHSETNRPRPAKEGKGNR